ncbi:MAG: 30S ribosomal protein S3 [Methanobacteriota archaeon]|nr:MAG: 30S ribosomal protein S3 [Euryarchaeota archaeon]
MERQLIIGNIKKVKVKEYLLKELDRAGIGDIDIQRTPMGTRVIVYAERPGIVIGKSGLTIRNLTETLKNEYGLEDPQIEVANLEVPELNAQVMAKSIASSLERGYHFRRAAYSALRSIMNAGAIGAQITISGKLTGERSRMEKFVDGYIKHCGEPAERLVLKGFAEAAPKLGRIGVKVKILPPGAVLPDDIKIVSDSEKPGEAVVAEPAEKEPETPKAVETAGEEDILEKPAKEVLKAIKGMDEKTLKGLLAKEKKNKKRKTVIEGIEKQLSKG